MDENKRLKEFQLSHEDYSTTVLTLLTTIAANQAVIMTLLSEVINLEKGEKTKEFVEKAIASGTEIQKGLMTMIAERKRNKT
jgi:uncharacterized membrane-anchored protein YjiN (DUF445 family)